MRLFSKSMLRDAVTLALTGICCSLGAQTFSAMTGTDAIIRTRPDLDSARATRPGHHALAEQPLLFGSVRAGVYTVDGMVAKARINDDVNGARFLYLFVPGIGTAVLSAAAEGDAVVTPAQLHDNELAFTVGDHHFTLTGVALSDGHNHVPDHLFVRLDRAAWHLSRQPMIGFGDATQLPYAWPGALPANTIHAEQSHLGPPVPVVLLPSQTVVQPVPPPAGAAH